MQIPHWLPNQGEIPDYSVLRSIAFRDLPSLEKLASTLHSQLGTKKNRFWGTRLSTDLYANYGHLKIKLFPKKKKNFKEHWFVPKCEWTIAERTSVHTHTFTSIRPGRTGWSGGEVLHIWLYSQSCIGTWCFAKALLFNNWCMQWTGRYPGIPAWRFDVTGTFIAWSATTWKKNNR